MTNATAMTVAWTARYDPFGNAIAVTAAITNNHRLPGQIYQIEDGLSYNWHRTYDPTIGRYTQADPLSFVDGPNIYNYAQQSTVMGVDQKGLTRIAGPMSTPNPSLCRPLPFPLKVEPKPLPDPFDIAAKRSKCGLFLQHLAFALWFLLVTLKKCQ